jgi:hypothetical protein
LSTSKLCNYTIIYFKYSLITPVIYFSLHI